MFHSIRLKIVKFTKILFFICTFSIFCLIKPAFCQESIPSSDSISVNIETVAEYGKQSKINGSGRWRQIWGNKARGAILLGMWSFHLSGSGEYLGDGGSNEQNHLLGIQYYGLAFGTFMNSHDDRAWFLGPAREVYSRQLSENTRLDVGYKFGPIYGYENHLPNIGGISLFAAGNVGFSWHKLGIDIMIIPVGVIAGGFRINFD